MAEIFESAAGKAELSCTVEFLTDGRIVERPLVSG